MSREKVELALAILKMCPYCAGLCRVPANGRWDDPEAEMVECSACDGCGDYDLARLRRVYIKARREALAEVRLFLEQMSAVINAPVPAHLTASTLRWDVDSEISLSLPETDRLLREIAGGRP